MKTTITGARGFVGSNLAAYLKTSHEVFSMSVRYKTHQELKLNGDAIVHLAGKAHDLKKVSRPQEYYEANFELTKQLFDVFLLHTYEEEERFQNLTSTMSEFIIKNI